MDNNRNLLITIVASVLILTLWQMFYVNPRIEAERETAHIEAEQTDQQRPAEPAGPGVSVAQQGTVPGAPGGAPGAQTRDAAVAASQRVRIDTPSLSGSINLVGGRIDDLRLKNFHVTVDDSSPNIELLNPAGVANGYFAETGFVGSEATGAVPGADTSWTLESGGTLTPSTPVVLAFTNETGLTFRRTIEVDADYMFTIADTVANGGTAPVSLASYGRVTRFERPTTAGIYVLHEGLIGVTGQEGLQEIDYSQIEEDKQIRPGKSTDGWLGITDKYWAVALVPPGNQPFQPRFAFFNDGRPRYQTDFLTDPVEVAPGGSATLETLVFAGAKESRWSTPTRSSATSASSSS